nr:hypothetical protein [Tanacetum cinerariifolium]
TSGLAISSFDVIVPEISIPSPNRQQSLLLSSPQAPPRGTNALVIPVTKCYGLLLPVNLFRAIKKSLLMFDTHANLANM